MPSPVAIVATKSPLEEATANRPLATQQAALQRWLDSSGAKPPAQSKPARPNLGAPTNSVYKPAMNEKVATLRDALAANGLTIAPGIHQLPALHKVVRLQDLLDHDF